MNDCPLTTLTDKTIIDMANTVSTAAVNQDVSFADLKATLISLGLGIFDNTQVISVKDPSATGTLIPQPPILPIRLGKILFIAFAAPVDVGIILIAAARALLKSL